MNYNLYFPEGTEFISYNEDSWHEERAKGIGGSDAAAVMGISKYKSKLKLYKEKSEGYREDLSENVYIKKGKDLEDLIRIRYCEPFFEKLGYTIIKPDVILVPESCKYMRANLDAFAIPKIYTGDYSQNIVVEIKWVSEYGEALWDGEEYNGVPVGYYAQVQHYMQSTGARKAIVCALFDRTWEMKFYEVKYDLEFVAKMIKEINTFMEINVGLHIPPKINSELDKAFIVDAINVLKEEPVLLVNDADMDILMGNYKLLKAEIKSMETEATEILSEITEKYLLGHRPESPLHKINISVVKNTTLDTKALKEDHPEIYQQYVKHSECSRTTLK